ncbi:hypothetical protein UWK_00467 [Desulfocapsa sulfexigens DSM 10523]|uniref:Lipoprotein n=1 Tax=Desulfocapsa sulfexigens (strain DSM 10523 / SB164P1) TaxID=1167006 RepID=M1PBC2_DESSD|nr:hypothetical protein [Desulfocapsa sulfexigens]AGF77050.1 hypothetical protein UWK_00467 [Desulfocapsa sulfexigens DSM 10523]
MKRVLTLSFLLIFMLAFTGCSDNDDDSSTATNSATGSGVAIPSSSEDGLYWGRHNGNRPHWYYSMAMRDYPNDFYLTVQGCTTRLAVNRNGTTRVELGGYLLKQSDVPGRGMVVLGPSSCYSRVSYIEFQ